MDYLEYRLGVLSRGDVVVITLSTGANVRLMDSANLSRFSRGAAHSYYGGQARTSPARITVPTTGSWYLTVDLGGFRANSVRVGISIAPGPNHRPYLPVPTRDDGYYSEHRPGDKDHYFIGPRGEITSERPHVHVIHSTRENRIIIEGTNTDGTHFGKQYLPFDSGWKAVDAVVATLRQQLR